MDTTDAPEDPSRMRCPSWVSSQIPWLLTIRGGGLFILAWRVETEARRLWGYVVLVVWSAHLVMVLVARCRLVDHIVSAF